MKKRMQRPPGCRHPHNRYLPQFAQHVPVLFRHALGCANCAVKVKGHQANRLHAHSNKE